jgi:hypothetical protein
MRDMIVGGKRSWLGSRLGVVLSVVAVLLGLSLLSACGTAIVTTTTAARSPSSGQNAADSSSTSTSSLPAIGSSISLTAADAVVPAGKLLEVRSHTPAGAENEYLLLDTHARKG